MRAATIVIGFLIAAGMALATESTAAQASASQAADEIVVLAVEGMT